MAEPTAEEIEAAVARGKARMRGPRAESARYDAGRNRIVVRLTTGIEIGFSPRDVEGLEHASAEDLKAVEVEALGLGIHFPKLDADLYVPSLMKGIMGSKRWMARERATAAARARHPAEPDRARAIGNPGGRRKIATQPS